jgi:hypothetical protein
VILPAMGPNQIDVRSDLHAGCVSLFVSIGLETKDESMDHRSHIDPSAGQLISVIRP